MSQYFNAARAWLAGIDPAAPAAALILTVFLAIYSLRRWTPGVWLKIESWLPAVDSVDPNPALKAVVKILQAIPGALVGAAIAALSSGLSVQTALWGVGSGAIASLAHELMAAYQGKVGGPAKLPPAPPASSRKPPRMFPSDPPVPPGLTMRALAPLLLCLTLGGCGLFAVAAPYLAEAAVVISDAVNAIDAAQALLPSLHLAEADLQKAEAAIAKARQALAAAAAVDEGAKDLTSEQLDASLAAFREAWSDLQGAFGAGKKVGLCEGCLFLQTPLAVKRVQK